MVGYVKMKRAGGIESGACQGKNMVVCVVRGKILHPRTQR